MGFSPLGAAVGRHPKTLLRMFSSSSHWVHGARHPPRCQERSRSRSGWQLRRPYRARGNRVLCHCVSLSLRSQCSGLFSHRFSEVGSELQ
jgi:hypothetical protein